MVKFYFTHQYAIYMQYQDHDVSTIEFDGRALKAARGHMPSGVLASKIGVSRQALWQFETGKAKPSAATLIRLCTVLGLSAQDLGSKKITTDCEVTLDK